METRNPQPQAAGPFESPRDRREFRIFLLATFLCFASTSQASIFSAVFAQAGMVAQEIGFVSSAWSIGAIVGPTMAPWLIRRQGALPTALIGWAVIFVAFAGLQLTYEVASFAAVARFLAGLGFGIFIPGGILYAKAKVRPSDQVYYIGIFSSMMMIPNLFGPGLAEWYLAHFGTRGYFVIMSLPLAAGILIGATISSRTSRTPPAPSGDGFRALLSQPLIILLATSILLTGLFWGFVSTLLALWLRQTELPAALFFTPFAATMLFSRFVLIRFMRGFHKPGIVIMGLLLMSLAHAFIAISMHPVTVVAAAIFFALGYSVVFPTVIVWGNEHLSADLQARLTAFLNIVFNGGGVIGPFIGGLAIQATGFATVAFGLASLGPIVIIGLLFRPTK